MSLSETVKLKDEEVEKLISTTIPLWKLDNKAPLIYRDFQFDSFLSMIDFVNHVAAIAEQQDHHPEMHLGYKNCLIEYTTHSHQGITRKDFDAAREIDSAYSDHGQTQA